MEHEKTSKHSNLITTFLVAACMLIQPVAAQRPPPKPPAKALQERLADMPARARACAERRAKIRCSRGDLADSKSLCFRLNSCLSACEAADTPQRSSRRPEPIHKQGLAHVSKKARCDAAYASVFGADNK